jgi:hypothetical protein
MIEAALLFCFIAVLSAVAGAVRGIAMQMKGRPQLFFIR